MDLPTDLIKKFAKAMKNQSEKKVSTANATVIEEDEDGILYVQLDGSEIKTPVEVLVDAEVDDRVAVQIKDHKATIINNYTSPPSSRKASKYMEMTEDGLLIGDVFGIDGSSLVVGNDKLYINNVDGECSFKISLEPIGYSDGTKRYGVRVSFLSGNGGSHIAVTPEASDSDDMDMSNSMASYTNTVSGKNGIKGYTQTAEDYAYYVTGLNGTFGYRVNWNGDLSCASFDSGEITGLTVSAGSTVSGNVTFNHDFNAVPIVVAGFFSEPTGSPVSDFGNCTVTVYNVTKNGFSYKVCNGGTANRSPRVSWIASRSGLI